MPKAALRMFPAHGQMILPAKYLNNLVKDASLPAPPNFAGHDRFDNTAI
jgi:hypothetical protein